MLTAKARSSAQSPARIISAALIILWTYAASSKLLDFDQARTEMLEQVFPAAMAEVLAWVVPLTELAVATLLFMKHTRMTGLKMSAALLLLFSGYIIAILLGTFGRIPCACGGILGKMGWMEHLLFNVFFLDLNFIALIQTAEERGTMGKGH
jgi:putative oxidoreductase